MANPFYLTVEAKLQGKFKGGSTHKKHEGAIVGLTMSYEITSPRDLVTGQAASKHRHGPITAVKAWDASTPQFFLALTNNEPLKSVFFEFVREVEGKETVYHTIRLTDARVSAIRQYAGTAPVPGAEAGEFEEVSFVFSEIEVVNVEGGTAAEDRRL